MQFGTQPSALTQELIAQLTAMLREQRRFRQEQLSELAAVPAEQSVAMAEVDAVVRRGAVAALAEIDAALARVSAGSYGLCTVCGGQIPLERLEVIPQTARCVACERAR